MAVWRQETDTRQWAKLGSIHITNARLWHTWGKKITSWLHKNMHTEEMSRNSCLWMPHNPLDVLWDKNISWYSINWRIIFIDKMDKDGCNLSACYACPQISPSYCLNNDAGKSIIFFITNNIFVKNQIHFCMMPDYICFNHLLHENFRTQLCKPLFGISWHQQQLQCTCLQQKANGCYWLQIILFPCLP